MTKRRKYESSLPWRRQELEGQVLCVPRGASAFAVQDEDGLFFVVRIIGVIPVPADDERSWPGVHSIFEDALREAGEREIAWHDYAVQALGRMSAALSADQPPTQFEQIGRSRLR